MFVFFHFLATFFWRENNKSEECHNSVVICGSVDRLLEPEGPTKFK